MKMKIFKRFLVILLVLFASALSLSFKTNDVLAEILEQNMFEVSFSCEDFDNSSGSILDKYTFTVNRINTSWTLTDGFSIEYRFTFDSDSYSGANNSVSFNAEKNAELVHVFKATVCLMFEREIKEELPLPSLQLKNGTIYEDPSGKPEEPVVNEPPVLSDINTKLTANYDIDGQNYAKYLFTIELIDVNLGDLYGLSTEWTFDGDVFTSENSIEMTTAIDPEKAHSVSAKTSVVRLSDGSVVSTLNIPVRYYKDGKILLNYIEKNDDSLEALFPLSKVILPAIAVIMAVLYYFYFRKERMSGGLDLTIDRLSNILGTSSEIEKIMNNANLGEKKKLAALRSVYRTVKLDLNGTLTMLKSSALEADVTLNTNYAVELLSDAAEFMNVDYKQYSLEELNNRLEELLSKHIAPAVAACKQIVATNKRNLKKYDH
ncbi:MAG: hypothetical protein SOV55_05955 [Candidatus Borkfalkiaceae bacterium]|nr:hypothetical protein [Christensenellaceae bacterium]